MWASGVMGQGKWAGVVGQTPAAAQWLPVPMEEPQGGVADMRSTPRHCSTVPYSLSSRALVFQAVWLCGAGSPGAAGWGKCWLMASRSVLGAFSGLGKDKKQDMGAVGREKWV